ncbi:MAG: hypothetical protein KF894_02090 [Labilithrix sp.]|nr:hypothetical protein [Labilithrix sp.]
MNALPSSPPGAVARPVRVLGPEARPVRKLPVWTLLAAAPVAVLAGAAQVVPALEVGAQLALVVALVSVCVLASWTEERIYHACARRALALRLVVGGALPVLAPFVGLVVGVLVELAFKFAGARAWAVPLFGIGGLWLSGCALGSLVVLLIDAVVSALIKSFRARISVAILCLLGVAFVLLLGATVGIVALHDAVQTGAITSHIRVEGPRATAEVTAFLEQMRAHPILVALSVYGLTAVVALPSVVSASGKLAEGVMDRIHPLNAAFDAVARGDRDVHLAEGGSEDFVQVSRRFNQMVDALKLGEQMERAFGTYVSTRLLDRIRSQHGEAQIPAQLRDASVFFADIRGFTSMSERLAPDAMVALLNRYFERVVALVDEHEGYLNKFIGDAVVVVWNGPVEQPRHAEKATACAIALQKLVAKMNDAAAFPEIGRLEIGIGVSSGPMVSCNIGSSQQMEYTVIGDTVNLAARLTSKAGPGEVWISERTAQALPADVPRVALEPFKVKGKDEPVHASLAWPA